MVLPDVNVLVHAHREDSSDHDRCRAWLEAVASSDEPFALADVVLSGFLRVVTHPRVFSPPSTRGWLDGAGHRAADAIDGVILDTSSFTSKPS